MTSAPDLSTSCLTLSTPPHFWQWNGLAIAYQMQGTSGPAVVLIHGFGASWGHWCKTMPDLAQTCRVYALDLLGFGASAKPQPSAGLDYTFETWGQQLVDFCREVVQTPVVLVGNSIGCLVAMQAAIAAPDQVLAVAMLNCSLRLLHERRRSQLPWYRQVGAGALQQLLGVAWFGRSFFKLIATQRTVRKALLQAYHQPEAVTDELVDMLLKPASDPGAADVFLAFTRYSQGPLPEDLLETLPCPALILWGTEDPWEPIALGRAFAEYEAVEDFIPLAGAGHCPQDEVPELVNPILRDWILKHSPNPASAHTAEQSTH